MRRVWTLARNTVFQFIDNGGTLLGAALSFYVVLSIAPLLLIVISAAGVVFGTHQVSGEMTRTLRHYLGANATTALTTMVEGFRDVQLGKGATILGGIVLLWSASRVFSQLQAALNQIWHVRTEIKLTKMNLLINLWKYVLAILLVLVSGMFFTAFVVFSAVITLLKYSIEEFIPGETWVWQFATFACSVLLLTAFVAIIFHYLADATVQWRDAWLGATVTAVLIGLVEYPLSYYLSHPAVTSGYGAAGSLVVVLLWVYYSAQVFLLGAQFTAVYAHAVGRGIAPDATATVVRDAPLEKNQDRAAASR